MVIEVVDNDFKYYEFIRCLRNDDRVKSGFIQTREISIEEQSAYMEKHGKNYIIVLVEGNPAGYAGSIDRDIRVCVHPDYQGKGIGCVLINSLMEKFPESYAKIKVENDASIRMFNKCGFKTKYIIMEREDETQSL